MIEINVQKITINLRILTSRGFLFCLLLLLINDFLLKKYFGNAVTGKLSDFAGLFIFPLFVSVFFQRYKIVLFIFTGVFFILWKSEFSQGFIDIWNNIGLLRIYRVVDYSDFLALLILPVSYFYEKSRFKTVKIQPVFPLIISAFAFVATSYQKDFDYNKTYNFPFSKEILLSKINMIKYDKSQVNLPLSVNIKNANDYFIERGSDTIWYFMSGIKLQSDTIFEFDKKKNLYTSEIDTIIQYKIIQRDSMFVNKSGIFMYRIPVRKYMPESSTGYCDWVYAKVKISGNDSSGSVSLLQIKTSNCMGMFEKTAQKNEEKNLFNAFEKEFVGKINDIK